MRFIIELTGPVVDPRPKYWAAYTTAAERLGLPRVDEAAFWRLVRSGAPEGQWVRGTKPAQLRDFQAQFAEALEADEHIALQKAQQDCAETLARLSRHGELVLVTAGSNRMARQLLLDRLDLSVHFTRMRGLPDDRPGRVRTLKELSEGDDRVVVAAGSEGVVGASQQAGLVAAGISNGAFVSNRLARLGASPIFTDLRELAADVERGAEKLVQAGLLPPRHQTVRNPFEVPDRAFASRARGGGSRNNGGYRRRSR